MRASNIDRQTTLGDLVVAAFARAESTSDDRRAVVRLAARDLEMSLKRARRRDLIRALVAAERAISGTIPLRIGRIAPLATSLVAPLAAAG